MTINGKDLIERISDKEYSEDLIKELEKYEVKKPKSVWELKKGDEVCFTTYIYDKSEYVSQESKWSDWACDKYNRELGMVHLTEERAELHARVLNTELAIKKWKRENDNVVFDWSDRDQRKYNLAYDAKYEGKSIDWSYALKHPNTIHFSSDSKARQCINDIGEERIIEWLKWEDNDQ